MILALALHTSGMGPVRHRPRTRTCDHGLSGRRSRQIGRGPCRSLACRSSCSAYADKPQRFCNRICHERNGSHSRPAILLVAVLWCSSSFPLIHQRQAKRGRPQVPRVQVSARTWRRAALPLALVPPFHFGVMNGNFGLGHWPIDRQRSEAKLIVGPVGHSRSLNPSSKLSGYSAAICRSCGTPFTSMISIGPSGFSSSNTPTTSRPVFQANVSRLVRSGYFSGP